MCQESTTFGKVWANMLLLLLIRFTQWDLYRLLSSDWKEPESNIEIKSQVLASFFHCRMSM